MKLYRFRQLTTCEEFCRVVEIIKTGEFWCSKFSEMNDPMEGVYYTPNSGIIDEIYNEKNKRKICSFSKIQGFENPAMWGYYAGGFKGIAIEIEVEETDEIKRVNYVAETPSTSDIDTILTTKLKVWECEYEYRFIKNVTSNKNKIGTITKVYLGNPYGDLVNTDKILNDNPTLQMYKKFKDELEEFLKKSEIPYANVVIIDNKVLENN
ncbi:MAG: hypothetical protein JZU62_06850 [Sulfuricurvum sp.]|uniref:hypothetical protein n=1 Tax=Sulfuricurvum sp. TaxID=2025608 RepID=UPI0025D93168|nr:hypothetical protein [Sulfuricurvum sp.]MBV5321386.1 hypothetical protein [Sulfuricurvum sp.]